MTKDFFRTAFAFAAALFCTASLVQASSAQAPAHSVSRAA